MKKEFLKLNRKPANPNKVPERSSKRSLPALSLVEVSLSKGRTAEISKRSLSLSKGRTAEISKRSLSLSKGQTAEVSLPKGVAIGILAAILLTACSDIGERNNINDYDGDNYAYGDDLYYLNRDGDGFDGEIRQGQVTGVHYIYDNGWRIASNFEKDTYDYSQNEPWGAGEIGEIRAGTFSVIFDPSTNTKSSIYYIFDGSWRLATDFERDTYNYEENKPWATGKNGEIRAGVISSTLYIFDGSWRIATDTEKDTYNYGKNKPWATGKNGEIRAGVISSTLYIFDGSWRIATDFEMDTYNYEKNKPWAAGKDGDLRIGAITGKFYVFDKSAWRVADNISNFDKDTYDYTKNKPWAAGKDGEIRAGAISSTLYIFDGSWRLATDFEKDTYNLECAEFGQIIHGKVNSDYAYFCYGKEWKRFYGNESIQYGKLVDERDGRIYRTIEIGEQTWMAENLNYADSINYPSMLKRNWCYNNSLDSCEKYGRLYTWSATIDSVYFEKKGKTCGFKESPCNFPDKTRGICPEGWHLPSNWGIFSLANLQTSGQTDAIGFSVLPTGRYDNGSFLYSGSSASFWIAYESIYGAKSLEFRQNEFIDGWSEKDLGLSVRCVKDEE